MEKDKRGVTGVAMKIKLEPKIFHFRGVCLISKTPEESEMLMALWLGKALCTVLSKVQGRRQLEPVIAPTEEGWLEACIKEEEIDDRPK